MINSKLIVRYFLNASDDDETKPKAGTWSLFWRQNFFVAALSL